MKLATKENPDKDLPSTAELIPELHTQPGKAENYFNLIRLNEQLIFQPGEYVDLKLTEEGRQLIFKGALRKGSSQDGGEIQVFLFDHALLLVQVKLVNKREEYRVHRKV